jgi:hypothetical protein
MTDAALSLNGVRFAVDVVWGPTPKLSGRTTAAEPLLDGPLERWVGRHVTSTFLWHGGTAFLKLDSSIFSGKHKASIAQFDLFDAPPYALCIHWVASSISD